LHNQWLTKYFFSPLYMYLSTSMHVYINLCTYKIGKWPILCMSHLLKKKTYIKTYIKTHVYIGSFHVGKASAEIL